MIEKELSFERECGEGEGECGDGGDGEGECRDGGEGERGDGGEGECGDGGDGGEGKRGEGECEDGGEGECGDGGEGEHGNGGVGEFESSESESHLTDDDSLYVPTPKRQLTKVTPIDFPNQLGFIQLPQLGKFMKVVNSIRSCTTPGCKGNLVAVSVKCRGLGGGIAVRYTCDGCTAKSVTLETHANLCGNKNTVSMSVQVAFIISGSTHAVYYKTLKHALGIQAVTANIFGNTIHAMHLGGIIFRDHGKRTEFTELAF